MNFTLEQLIAFQTAAEEGSFSAAARKLGKAQSVISTSVSNLELDLGIELFDRSHRYPVLTSAGNRLLQDAQRIVLQCQEMQALAGELADGTESRITLAVDDESHLPWLSAVLDEFAHTFPKVELEILFPLMKDLAEMLESERAHLGLGYQLGMENTKIASTPLGAVKLVVVVSATHALAKKENIAVADLVDSRLIALTARIHGAEPLLEKLVANQVWRVEGDLAVVEMVRKGYGWAVVPEFLVQPLIADQQLAVLEPPSMPGWPLYSLEVFWLRSKAQGKAGQWLKEQMSRQGKLALQRPVL